MKILLKTASMSMIIPRLVVGLIFLSEGLQKYITPFEAGAGRFAKIGFSHPEFWAYFTGSFEIICGLLILVGFITRIATIPLLIIMVVAFISTKLPLLMSKGFWPFAHEYRTDFAVTLLLILLLKYGAGKTSIDSKVF
jgi:putative oxidoreductase